mgnify:CR=1 FL=1
MTCKIERRDTTLFYDKIKLCHELVLNKLKKMGMTIEYARGGTFPQVAVAHLPVSDWPSASAESPNDAVKYL